MVVIGESLTSEKAGGEFGELQNWALERNWAVGTLWSACSNDSQLIQQEMGRANNVYSLRRSLKG